MRSDAFRSSLATAVGLLYAFEATACSNGKAEIRASVGEELSTRLPVEFSQLAASAVVEPKRLGENPVGGRPLRALRRRDRQLHERGAGK